MRFKTLVVTTLVAFSIPVIGQEKSDRLDFRSGAGISLMGSGDMRTFNYENGVLVDLDYSFDKRNSFGCNIIIENSYLLTDRVLIGLKLFTQPYFNGDINSGLLFKLGLKI